MSFMTRPWFAVAVCLLVIVPFLTVTIPPLTDVPGHMASAAVAAYAGDPALARLLGFHWHILPNLGTDIIVTLLQRMIGITRAFWIVSAIIPPSLAAGIFMIARRLNPRGAAAIPWALIFIYSYPFNYGFLNYLLGVAVSLIGFASWMSLDEYPRLREAMTWIFTPLLFLCHAVAGCLFVLFVCSREFSLLRGKDQFRSLLRRLRPLASSVVILLAWRLSAKSFAGENEISIEAKLNALVMILRDQNLLLDEGSVLMALLVFMLGWWKGARLHRAVVPALLFLIPLFFITPSSLNGSSFADERLLPLIPILAFAAQDWSFVDVRLTRLVALAGLALFGVRLVVTLMGFVAYDRQFTNDLVALQHVREHSRILVLNTRYCSARQNWRPSRLGHLGDLAVVYRRSWTNTGFDTDGAHLLDVRYRPSTLFYDDPSQYVWPISCGGVGKGHPTLRDALAAAPLEGVDYVWLIDAALPAGYRDPRLELSWQNSSSAIYDVRPIANPPEVSKERGR
jgi:hypothetical protein